MGKITTQIRSGVFETNSSSVHNFTMDPEIGPEEECTKEEAIRDVMAYNGIGSDDSVVYDPKTGVIDLTQLPFGAMSFGREYTRITGFFGKALYALAAYSCEDDMAGVDSIMGFIQDFIGASKIKCLRDHGFYGEPNDPIRYSLGEIDHQSVGYLQCFIADRNITIKEFLLGKRYAITTTCDG